MHGNTDKRGREHRTSRIARVLQTAYDSKARYERLTGFRIPIAGKHRVGHSSISMQLTLFRNQRISELSSRDY